VRKAGIAATAYRSGSLANVFIGRPRGQLCLRSNGLLRGLPRGFPVGLVTICAHPQASEKDAETGRCVPACRMAVLSAQSPAYRREWAGTNRNRGFTQLSTATAFPTFLFQFAAMCMDRLNRSRRAKRSRDLIPHPLPEFRGAIGVGLEPVAVGEACRLTPWLAVSEAR